MKTVHLHSSGDLRRHDEPVPIAGLSEKLVRIKSVGLCGSDLHWFYEGDIEDAMLEPLGFAIHSVDLGKIKAGITVGVLGCGPIGLLII